MSIVWVYICPECGTGVTIKSFWKWFFTPHMFNKKHLKCEKCGKKRYMKKVKMYYGD